MVGEHDKSEGVLHCEARMRRSGSGKYKALSGGAPLTSSDETLLDPSLAFQDP
jgi:hypothetical protein